MKPTLVILAAGMASRYGSMKQVEGFGPSGEGYVRFALTVDQPRLEEAIDRLSKLTW